MPENYRLFAHKNCQTVDLPPLKKMIEMPRAKIVPQTFSIFDRYLRIFERFTARVEERGRDLAPSRLKFEAAKKADRLVFTPMIASIACLQCQTMRCKYR